MRSVLILATLVLAWGTAFAAELPKHIAICKSSLSDCVFYSVSEMPSLPHAYYGQTFYEFKAILIAHDLPVQRGLKTVMEPVSGFEKASTLLHECEHAVLFEYGWGPKEQEHHAHTPHEVIKFGEAGLTRLIHDNPPLIHYLQGAY